MTTEIPTSATTTEKKKLPGWAKLIIVLAILGAGLSVLVGVGFAILGGFLATKSGQNLTEQGIERGLERMIEKGMENQGGGQAKVDLTKDGLTIQDQKSGQQFAVRAGHDLPANFPSDVPIYSPSQMQGSLVMGPMTTVTLESSSLLSDIMNFYQDNFRSKGWTSVLSSTTSPENYSGIFKKENRQVMVNLSAQQGKTSIALSYGIESTQ